MMTSERQVLISFSNRVQTQGYNNTAMCVHHLKINPQSIKENYIFILIKQNNNILALKENAPKLLSPEIIKHALNFTLNMKADKNIMQIDSH